MNHETLEALNHAIVTDLLPTVLSLFALYAVKLIVPAIKAFAAKAGLELDSRQEAKLQFIVEKWVRVAEESVEQAARNHPITDKGIKKLETAISGIVSEMPNVSPEVAEILVHATITKFGLGAAAKTATTISESIKQINMPTPTPIADPMIETPVKVTKPRAVKTHKTARRRRMLEDL